MCSFLYTCQGKSRSRRRRVAVGSEVGAFASTGQRKRGTVHFSGCESEMYLRDNGILLDVSVNKSCPSFSQKKDFPTSTWSERQNRFNPLAESKSR